MRTSATPIGVILAGGLGRRMGGAKATAELRGRPLIDYPLQALRAALGDVAIVAKADSELPHLPGVTVWTEPSAPSHPLVGIVHALGLAGNGRPILVCAADMPFVPPALVTRIAATDPAGAPAVVPTCNGELQPLLALYLPAATAALARVVAAEGPLRSEVAAIGPRLLEVEDRSAFFNVNTPEDLLVAEAILDRGRRR
jgi:molybdopterin-guanine dinucleotide biosynthesis protein A